MSRVAQALGVSRSNLNEQVNKPASKRQSYHRADDDEALAWIKPVASPESNGVAEAFVKTLKRDYVNVNPLPNGTTVLGCINGWIEDYNEFHPHSRLKMRSPREHIRALTKTA